MTGAPRRWLVSGCSAQALRAHLVRGVARALGAPPGEHLQDDPEEAHQLFQVVRGPASHENPHS